MKMGGGPKQFGVDAEQVPALLRRDRPARAGLRGLPPLRRLAEPAAPSRSARRSARRYELALRLAAARAGAGALAQPRRRLRHPLLPGRAAARPGADRRQPARDSSSARERELPQARARDRARPLPGRRGRHLRLPRRRPQGLARPGVPRHRRRPAPPPGGLGQLRPGDPQELPGRDRQPDRRRRSARRPRWSGRCARRSTCWPTAWTCRWPTSGDLVVVFQSGAYGATRQPAGLPGPPGLRRGAGLTRPPRVPAPQCAPTALGSEVVSKRQSRRPVPAERSGTPTPGSPGESLPLQRQVGTLPVIAPLQPRCPAAGLHVVAQEARQVEPPHQHVLPRCIEEPGSAHRQVLQGLRGGQHLRCARRGPQGSHWSPSGAALLYSASAVRLRLKPVV